MGSYLQRGHRQVGIGLDPVSRLHPVRAPDPGDSRVTIKVDIQLELSDKVEVLQVVLSGLIVRAGIGTLIHIG